MHRTHRTLAGALAITLTLLISACGSSGGSDSGKDVTTTAAGKTTTTEASTEEAQARADSVDLEVSDLPDGWKASPASSDDEDSPVKACDPTFSDEDAKVAKHSTDDFSIGSLDQADGTTLSTETVVFTDAKAADAAVEVFHDADVVSCIDEAVKGQLADSTGLTVDGSLQQDKVDFGTDHAAEVSATYTLTADDGSVVNATVAVMALSTGDIGTMVTILSLGDSLDPQSLRPTIQTLADLQGKA